MQARSLEPVAPSEVEFETPSSRPRQESREGKQIEAVLSYTKVRTW